ncbi:hypothetical protein VTK56DRAFT_2857 [Thermocarpiscus australiensis]
MSANQAQKVVIITGAASGIGKALATRLIEKNWLVGLVDINEAAGKDLASQLGPNAYFARADVSDYASQAAAFDAICSRWGRLDALCANAGIVERGSLYYRSPSPVGAADIPPPPDLSATDVDYKGVIYSVRLATHFMRHSSSGGGGGGGGSSNRPDEDVNLTKEKGAGSRRDDNNNTTTKKIVATASVVGGVVPHPALPEYSGAKAAVVGFVRAVAPVLQARERIAVGAVCPGLAATPILPAAVVDAVDPAAVTPVATIVRAYERFLDDAEEGEEEEEEMMAGQVLECVGDQIVPVVFPTMGSGDVGRKMMAMAMEPIFELLHGERSGLDGYFDV